MRAGFRGVVPVNSQYFDHRLATDSMSTVMTHHQRRLHWRSHRRHFLMPGVCLLLVLLTMLLSFWLAMGACSAG